MNKITGITVTDEFDKIKKELARDLQIIQTEYSNTQKKLKVAEEIFQKSKQEYKKLNDEHSKLIQYKTKCEKYIEELKEQINKLQQELNLERNRFKYSVERRPRQYYRRQRQEEEEEDEYEDELYEDDGNELDVDNIVELPPKKKLKKGISKYI